MTIRISSAFDGGNIIVLGQPSPSEFDLAIRKDAQSEFFQWFYFRLTGAKGTRCLLRIGNCAQSAYPDGWHHYQARMSYDRTVWTQATTSYAAGVLTIDITPTSNHLYLAYFAPYTMEQHHDLITRTVACAGVDVEVLGHTLDGRDIDLLTLSPLEGRAAHAIWLIARQHPGETMAEYWMEGALARLTDLADPVVAKLRAQCTFYVVPNMNPDGSARGHLRTNAVGVNLNREWDQPSLERSPEVFHVLNKMKTTGCDFNLDVHGDESLPHNFIAGFDGIPSITPHQLDLMQRYQTALERMSPDFQTKVGYPRAKAGQANMSMSTNAIAERFGCLAMTLEMPFKDTLENPDSVAGWSPERARHLGRSCLDALWTIVGDLRR